MRKYLQETNEFMGNALARIFVNAQQCRKAIYIGLPMRSHVEKQLTIDEIKREDT